NGVVGVVPHRCLLVMQLSQCLQYTGCEMVRDLVLPVDFWRRNIGNHGSSVWCLPSTLPQPTSASYRAGCSDRSVDRRLPPHSLLLRGLSFFHSLYVVAPDVFRKTGRH